MRDKFEAGDLVMLIDRKGRKYILTLNDTGTFHTHMGTLPHSELIGQEAGSWFTTSHGQNLLAIKPTLAEYVQKVPRATQVIYPKDMGNILLLGDIYPGATVLEAGLGSGALTSVLLRAVGERGRVVSYENREEQIPRAMKMIHALVGEPQNLTVKVADIYQGIEESDLDRIVLDVPEPWQVVPAASEALVPGGILLSFLPTVLQVHQLARALAQDPRFQLVETIETLLRPWHVTLRSVRPAHRMVAHTGFITTARKCSPRPGAESQLPIEWREPEKPTEEDQNG